MSEDQFDALTGSMNLLDSDGLPAALRLLDDAITEAVRQDLNDWVEILCNHATVLCDIARDFTRKRHYYELSLRHNPASYTALYGLACVSLDEGQIDLARDFAKRAYESSAAAKDPLAHSMIDLIKHKWPDISAPTES